MAPGDEILSVALQRRDVLDSLREPTEKRDLVERLGASRSTVDRAVRDLEMAGLVGRVDGSYRLTAVGSGILDAVEELHAVSEGAAETVAGFESVPSGVRFPPELLADGTVSASSDSEHGLPEALRERLREATEIRVIAPTETAPAVLAACREHSNASIDFVLDEEFIEELAEQFPGLTRWLASAERVRPLAGSVPSVAVILLRTNDTEVVHVVGHDERGTVTGSIETTDPAALEWGRIRIEEAVDTAEPVLEDGHVDATDAPARTDVLSREGIVELTPSYFAAREAAPLLTGWRAGLDLSEVAAGYAVERTVETDRGRKRLLEHLTDRLLDGHDVALVGPPGSGKSTVCKAVACEWYRERGPVFYRESGTSEPFTSWPTFADWLRSTDGHALVVVEDAVRPDANAVFRLMQAFPDSDVTFLFDARADEWANPSGDDIPEGFRSDIDVVEMPTLDEHDTEQFLERFETSVGSVDSSAAALLDAVDAAEEGHARLLCVLHRLSLLADPLAEGAPTSLDESVRELASTLRAEGPLAEDAGLLMSLCTVAGIEVTPDLIATLAPADPESVQAALSLLEGRVLFERPAGESYRTVHEVWAGQYLRAIAQQDGIRERVGSCLSRLLAPADDADLRRRITESFDSTPTMDRIEADPTAWTNTIVERLFAVGLERPNLAPLFGESDPESVAFPDACDPETIVEVTERRARMARYAGKLDRAEQEYERLTDRAASRLEERSARRYAAEREIGLGIVARKRSEYETAAAHYERARELFEALDDERGVADARKNLGTVALLQGDLEAAERELEWAHERLEALGEERLASYARFNLASVREEQGDLEAAIESYRDCLAYYRRSGVKADEADVHLNLGVALVIRGDIDTAADHYKSALGIYREVGDSIGVANAIQNHGEVAKYRGNLDQAAEYYGRAEVKYETVGEEWGQLQCRVACADIDLQRGDSDTAERNARRALDRLEAIGDRRGAMDARRVIAAAMCERGAFDSAEDHLEAALETGREGGYPRRTGQVLVAYGNLERARGAPDAAHERYTAAADHFESASAIGDLVGVHLTCADTYEAAGNSEQAETHRTRAMELRESVDFNVYVDESAVAE